MEVTLLHVYYMYKMFILCNVTTHDTCIYYTLTYSNMLVLHEINILPVDLNNLKTF
jgi:hypothetical protein